MIRTNGGGKYIGTDFVKLIFRVDGTALTSLLTYNNVYKYGTDWNYITTSVHVDILNYSPGMPSVSGHMMISGKTFDDDTLGELISYNAAGEPVGENSDWKYVAIHMNTDPDAFAGADDQVKAARKTFLHEVGHALKLSHPEKIPI